MKEQESGELADFIFSGSIYGLNICSLINKTKGSWISSIETHPNGEPVFYKWKIEGLFINIGIDEYDKVEYLSIHTKDLPQDLCITFNDFAFKLVTSNIDELLIFLNLSNIEWKFKKVFEKIITVTIERSNVEFVFSYFPDDYNIDNRKLAVIQKSR